MSGTITLPSGDKLITQTEIIDSGALVHREEVIVSGTISGRLALPTNSDPSLNDYGLPVREISGPKIGVAGTPFRIDPTGTTTQPVSINTTVTVSVPGTPGVIVTSQPAISFNGPQPISSVAGTVQVAFTPVSTQNVNLINVGFSGTPLRVDPTGQTTQPVSLAGTISLPDYARYSEQQTQTTSLGLLDDVIHVINAALGKVAAIGAQRNDSSPTVATEGAIAPPRITSYRAFHTNLRNESGQEVGTAGTPLRFDPTGTTTQPVSISGTLSIPDYSRYSEQLTQSSRLSTIDTDVIATKNAIIGTPGVSVVSLPSISFSSPQAVTFSGQQPIHGTVVISSIPPVTFASSQPISTVAGTVSVSFPSSQSVNISGTISLPDYSRYSEQLTQSSRLSTIDTDVLLVRDGVIGTPAVKFATPQQITFFGQQPVHGTVVASSLPPITFASAQPISTMSGTISLADYARYSEQQPQTTALQLIDDTVHATNAALGKITAIGGQRDDESTTLATENAVAPTRITSYRAQHVSLRNEIGVEVGSAGTPLRFDPTGTTTQPVSNTVISVVGGGAEATAQRVTIANDSTGVLSVDDNGGNLSIDDGGNSITVDGQLNVLLQNYGHSGTPLRVDPTGTTTQPISWSGVPTVSVPGTVTVNVRNSTFTYKTAKIDIAATGSATIVNSIANRRIKAYAINFQATRAGTISPIWLDGAASLSGTQTYMDREGYAMSTVPPSFLIGPQPGTALVLHVPATTVAYPFGGGGKGWVSYWDDDSF